MPMIPMGPEEQLEQDPMAAMMGGPEAPPMMAGPGGDPMMDGPAPAPEELAMFLGSQIAAQAEQGHMAIEADKNMRLQQVMGMIAQAAEGAQVLGPGQIA